MVEPALPRCEQCHCLQEVGVLYSLQGAFPVKPLLPFEPVFLEFEPIGGVELKGFPQPIELFVARAKGTDGALGE